MVRQDISCEQAHNVCNQTLLNNDNPAIEKGGLKLGVGSLINPTWYGALSSVKLLILHKNEEHRVFSIQDALNIHIKSVAWLKEKLCQDFSGKAILVT